MSASAGICAGEGDDGGAAVGGGGAGAAADGAGVGVGSGAGVAGWADCGAATIGAGGGLGSGAGGVAADGAGGVTSAGTFLTDAAEVCGAIGCSLSLRGQKAKLAANNIPTDSATNQVFVLIAPATSAARQSHHAGIKSGVKMPPCGCSLLTTATDLGLHGKESEAAR